MVEPPQATHFTMDDAGIDQKATNVEANYNHSTM